MGAPPTSPPPPNPPSPMKRAIQDRVRSGQGASRHQHVRCARESPLPPRTRSGIAPPSSKASAATDCAAVASEQLPSSSSSPPPALGRASCWISALPLIRASCWISALPPMRASCWISALPPMRASFLLVFVRGPRLLLLLLLLPHGALEMVKKLEIWNC